MNTVLILVTLNIRNEKISERERSRRAGWYFPTAASLRLISISFQLRAWTYFWQSYVLYSYTCPEVHGDRSIPGRASLENQIPADMYSVRLKHTRFSCHSVFNSCELFYSHVTNCIKRTNRMVIDAFTVLSRSSYAIYNKSFITRDRLLRAETASIANPLKIVSFLGYCEYTAESGKLLWRSRQIY